MPVLKSSKKALRVSLRRKVENLQRKKSLKTAIRNLKKNSSGKSDQVKDNLAKAQSALDKLAKTYTIHKNKAARLKSRLAKKVATK